MEIEYIETGIQYITCRIFHDRQIEKNGPKCYNKHQGCEQVKWFGIFFPLQLTSPVCKGYFRCLHDYGTHCILIQVPD
jgi:hypothetical protein